MLERCVDGGHFFEHVHVVFGEHADPAEVLEGHGALVAGHEPTWGLFDEEESDEHQAGGDELHGKWDDPLRVVCWQCCRDTILDFSQFC